MDNYAFLIQAGENLPLSHAHALKGLESWGPTLRGLKILPVWVRPPLGAPVRPK